MEKDSSFQRELIDQEIVDEALQDLSDSELQLLRSFVGRGAPFADATAEERAANERYQALYEAAALNIGR